MERDKKLLEAQIKQKKLEIQKQKAKEQEQQKKKEARLRLIQEELKNVPNYGKEFSKKTTFKKVKKSEMKKIKAKYPKVKDMKYEKVLEETTQNSSRKYKNEDMFEKVEVEEADQKLQAKDERSREQELQMSAHSLKFNQELDNPGLGATQPIHLD